MAEKISGKPVEPEISKAAKAAIAAQLGTVGLVSGAPPTGKEEQKLKIPPPRKFGKFAPKPPEPKNPSPTTPPEKKSTKPCGVASVLLRDAETREPEAQLIQVVPKPSLNEKVTDKWLSVIELERSKGGEETLTAEVKSIDGKSDGRKQACMVRVGAVWEEAWKDGARQTFKIKAHSDTSKWPKDVEPEIYYVFGRGCDDAVTRYMIEVFPSQQYKVKIDVKELQELIEAISGGFTGLVKYWVRTPDTMSDDKLSDAKEDQDFEEGRSTKQEKTFKNVGFEVAWGWQEEKKEWRTFYSVEISAGCDPLLNFGWKPKVSFAKLAYTAMGCPPGLSGLIAEHVFDIYIQFEFIFTLKVMGTAKFHYYTYGENNHSGAVKGEGGGQLGVVLGAKIGSRWIVAIIVEGAARASIVVALEVEVDSECLALNPEVTIEPLKISVSVKLVAFLRTAREAERTWELGGPWEIYPQPDSTPLKWPKPAKTS